MSTDPNEAHRFYRDEAARTWDEARSQALAQRLLGIFTRQSDLLSFDDVREKLRLSQGAYKGLQEIPLDQIVGSVSRYNDFTREFLPKSDSPSTAQRWKRIATLRMIGELPPIDVFKVGDVYFVKDGNHRVSVAKQLEAENIPAYVWEYNTPVGLSPDSDINDVLIRAEYQDFLDQTNLQRLRPAQDIVFTSPGNYQLLMEQIALYRRNLSLIDGYDVPWEQAVTAWYDLSYLPMIDMIRETGVMERFDNRTEADLYVWLYKHRHELIDRFGSEEGGLRRALTEFVEEEKTPVLERAVRSVVGGIERFVHDVFNGESVEPKPLPPIMAQFAQMLPKSPALALPQDGRDAWKAWRPELRHKLRDLLGIEAQSGAQVPSFEIIAHDTRRGVRIEKLRMRVPGGLAIPATVCSPDSLRLEGRAPALLIYPGHGTVEQAVGSGHSALDGAAVAIAREGFVVMAVEGRGFGELSEADHLRLDSAARLLGRTWMGFTIQDGLCALDYLAARPDVLADRIAVTGIGMGGALALYTGALDERVIATITQDYCLRYDSEYFLMERHTCESIPGLQKWAHFSDVAALIAPRCLLFVSSNMPTLPDPMPVFREIGRAWELLNVPDRLRIEFSKRGHVYAVDPALRFLRRWLVEEDDMDVLREPGHFIRRKSPEN